MYIKPTNFNRGGLFNTPIPYERIYKIINRIDQTIILEFYQDMGFFSYNYEFFKFIKVEPGNKRVIIRPMAMIGEIQIKIYNSNGVIIGFCKERDLVR